MDMKIKPVPIVKIKKKGRPTTYRQEVADHICQELSNGKSLRSICRKSNMPSLPTVVRWALDETLPFYAQYTQAKNIAAELLFEDILAIATYGNITDVMRARLRVDTIKWYLSKVLPKKYGDQATLNVGVGFSLNLLRQNDEISSNAVAAVTEGGSQKIASDTKS